MIVTVTMNAALDRTLTVPNFQEGSGTARARSSRWPGARGSPSPAR